MHAQTWTSYSAVYRFRSLSLVSQMRTCRVGKKHCTVCMTMLFSAWAIFACRVHTSLSCGLSPCWTVSQTGHKPLAALHASSWRVSAGQLSAFFRPWESRLYTLPVLTACNTCDANAFNICSLNDYLLAYCTCSES